MYDLQKLSKFRPPLQCTDNPIKFKEFRWSLVTKCFCPLCIMLIFDRRVCPGGLSVELGYTLYKYTPILSSMDFNFPRRNQDHLENLTHHYYYRYSYSLHDFYTFFVWNCALCSGYLMLSSFCFNLV
jgi:hypothetical protein